MTEIISKWIHDFIEIISSQKKKISVFSDQNKIFVSTDTVEWTDSELRSQQKHWNETVIILTKFPSLPAPKVVNMTTSGAANDENFVKITFPFQWLASRIDEILMKTSWRVNVIRINGLLLVEIIGLRWFPHTKVQQCAALIVQVRQFHSIALGQMPV